MHARSEEALKGDEDTRMIGRSVLLGAYPSWRAYREYHESLEKRYQLPPPHPLTEDDVRYLEGKLK